MASYGSTRPSPYRGDCIVIPTKHAKSVAIAPPFRKWLDVGVLEWLVDTDMLGTFSGELQHEGTAPDCAQRECVWAIGNLGVDTPDGLTAAFKQSLQQSYDSKV